MSAASGRSGGSESDVPLEGDLEVGVEKADATCAFEVQPELADDAGAVLPPLLASGERRPG